MMRELFFPRTFQGKLLFSERTVGISLEDNTVRAVHLHASRHKKKVAFIETYQVNEGEEKTFYQRLSTALKKAQEDFPKNPQVRATFPSSKVVIKELTVPFLDVEKIRMVIEYEIESSIPFSLENAVVDFIIIDQSEVKQSSTILVAAAQLDDVKKYVDAFDRAGITLNALTIDTFALSDLLSNIPPYDELSDVAALVDIGTESTRIALIKEHTMIATRTIQKGSGFVAEKTTAKARKKLVTELLDEISFTLNSFEVKNKKKVSLKKVFYRGSGELFEEFSAFCSGTLKLVCERAEFEGVLAADGISSKVSLPHEEWNAYATTLGAALPSPRFIDFTLRKKAAAPPVGPLVRRYLFTAVGLFTLLFGSLGIQGYLDTRYLSQQIEAKEKKAVQTLRGILPKDNRARKRSSLNALLKATESHIQEQEEIWAPFARERLLPNEIILELCMLFNRKKYNLTIEEVVISAEENEAHPIEVTGMFRSQGGGSDHFAQFGALEEEIKASQSLTLTEEIDPTLEEDGIRFVVRLKQAEDGA